LSMYHKPYKQFGGNNHEKDDTDLRP